MPELIDQRIVLTGIWRSHGGVAHSQYKYAVVEYDDIFWTNAQGGCERLQQILAGAVIKLNTTESDQTIPVRELLQPKPIRRRKHCKLIDDGQLREYREREKAYEDLLEARRVEAKRNFICNLVSEQTDRPRHRVSPRKRNSVSFSAVREEKVFSAEEPPIDIGANHEVTESEHSAQALRRNHYPEQVPHDTLFSEHAGKRRKLTHWLYKRRCRRLERGVAPDRAISPARIGLAFVERGSESDTTCDESGGSTRLSLVNRPSTRRSAVGRESEDEADELGARGSSEMGAESNSEAEYEKECDRPNFKEMSERFIHDSKIESDA